MKPVVLTFVIISLVCDQEILAKLNGLPDFLDSNAYNGVNPQEQILRFHEKHGDIIDDCYQELGIRGVCLM